MPLVTHGRANHVRELSSTTVKLDFEGVADGQQVADYYNGAGGPNYGVTFGRSAVGVVDSDSGGTGSDLAKEPSNSTAIFLFGSGGNEDERDFLAVEGGFTGIHFQYASYYNWSIYVYDASRTLLLSGTVVRTGKCQLDGIPACGDPSGSYGIWKNFSASFPGVAKSIRYSGALLNQENAYIDDVRIQMAPPTNPPTKAPTSSPSSSCDSTVYWIYNAATNALTRKLVNNSVVCLAHPYSIEVRPCSAEPAQVSVTMRLVHAPSGRVVHRQWDGTPPFFLFGDVPSTEDVRPSPKPLPDGAYYLSSNVGGRISFTQSCPRCPKGKKGMKGCMMK
jgi:hypothetical protein